MPQEATDLLKQELAIALNELQTYESTSAITMSAISNAILNGLSPLCVTIPMTGVEWADKYFYLPEGSSHIAGRWKTQPVQLAMLNMMTNDAIKIVSVRKSARLGYTKVLVAALLYFAEHKKRSSVTYQPIDDESDGVCC